MGGHAAGGRRPDGRGGGGRGAGAAGGEHRRAPGQRGAAGAGQGARGGGKLRPDLATRESCPLALPGGRTQARLRLRSPARGRPLIASGELRAAAFEGRFWWESWRWTGASGPSGVFCRRYWPRAMPGWNALWCRRRTWQRLGSCGASPRRGRTRWRCSPCGPGVGGSDRRRRAARDAHRPGTTPTWPRWWSGRCGARGGGRGGRARDPAPRCPGHG